MLLAKVGSNFLLLENVHGAPCSLTHKAHCRRRHSSNGADKIDAFNHKLIPTTLQGPETWLSSHSILFKLDINRVTISIKFTVIFFHSDFALGLVFNCMIVASSNGRKAHSTVHKLLINFSELKIFDFYMYCFTIN